MTITTLLAYWSDQKNQADKELSDAWVALTTAQNELVIQRTKLAKANQELADLATQTKKIRAELAEAATPADVDALESRLAKAINDTRAKQAGIIVIETDISVAQTTLNLANAEANAATTRASSVAAALEPADHDKDRVKVEDNQAVRVSNSVIISNLTGHSFIVNDAITVMGMTDSSFDGTFTISAVTDTSITYPQTAADATSGGGVIFGKRALRLRHKLTEPPLITLDAEATAALAAKPWIDAKARIEADFPLELRDLANERANVELAGLGNDQQEAREINNLLGAVIDQTENLREIFINADADFRDYIVNAKRRFDQALAIAARVADSKQNPLTEAEDLSIHSKKPDGSIDTALQTKRNTAAAARKSIATAQIDVDAKQTAVDLAILKAKATDIDGDPDNDPAVTTAKSALVTAETNLASAKTAFTSDMQTDLNDWETAVPDTAWRNLADFENAERLLTMLQTTATLLVTAMDTAEANLVVALLAADKARRTLKFLGSEAQKAASKSSFDTGILPRRVLGALRGDS